MLQVADDLTAENFLALWECASTPAQAGRIDKASLAKILKAHRVRRIGAAETLRILRRKPLQVAAGATEAAVAHIKLAAECARLVNRQLKDANQKLEALCARLEQPDDSERESEPGQRLEQRDVAILRSLPGVGRTGLATLLVEATEPLRRRDYHVLRGRTVLALYSSLKEETNQWRSHQSIRRASIIIKRPLITTLPPIIITKPRIIMILASTKRRSSTPKRLTNIAGRRTRTPRPPTNTLTNNGLGRRRCRRPFLVSTDLPTAGVSPRSAHRLNVGQEVFQ